MGAKYKLLDLVVPAVERIADPEGVVVDLMAGTHAVGYALKQNHKIIANDIQTYSEVVGNALLINRRWSTVAERVELDFRGCQQDVREPGWFSRVYSDTYFSELQCRDIEAIRKRISELEDDDLRSVYLLALCSAMALCQSSPGHFAQFLPSQHPRVQSLRSMSLMHAFVTRCKELTITTSNLGNRVMRADSLHLVSSDDLRDLAAPGSVVYLDPPYTTAQYSRYYHLLETVVLNDEPEVSFKGLYRQDRYQSPFCSTSRASASFAKIIRACADQGWPLVVSYSSHGLLEINELVELLSASFPKVLVNGSQYNHSMQGRGVVQDRTEFVLSGFW
jgi:adenine-specific DNA-methyltransferase